MIYLDNAATTKIDTEVLDAMLPYLKEEYGNAGAMYSLGRSAKSAVEKARQQVADFLNCKPENVIFTSGGSEGNSFVLYGVRDYLASAGKTTIVSSTGEHDSVICALEDIKCTMKPQFHIAYLPIGGTGTVSPRDVKAETATEDVGLVSVMYVNNELGTVNPVSEIADICLKRGILFHTDCVQAAGSLPLDVEDIGCDFLTISSHKIHGPKGVGAVYAKRPEILHPLVRGGENQEFGLRGGTENVPGIVGFGKACEVTAKRWREFNIMTSTAKQSFYNAMMTQLADNGLEHIAHVNGESVVHNGKILNVRFDGVDAESLLLMLDGQGVCLSAGSACHSRKAEPSRVLLAYGLEEQEARSSIRVSFSKMTSEEEAAVAGRAVGACVTTLRKMS